MGWMQAAEFSSGSELPPATWVSFGMLSLTLPPSLHQLNSDKALVCIKAVKRITYKYRSKKRLEV